MGTMYQNTKPAGLRKPRLSTPPASQSEGLSTPPDSQSESSIMSMLARDLVQLCNSQMTADVVFIVGAEAVEFYAHRLILWVRCRNFSRYKDEFWGSGADGGGGGGGGGPPRSCVRFHYKHYDPGLFSQLLQYIYSGVITLQDASVFSVIVMARDFGLPELLSMAEEHVLHKLSVDNACLFLNAALHLEKLSHDLPGCSESFPDVCLRFIERNAERCALTESWLELPKSAIIKLVSSQNFSLEEDKVWKAVLSWAKYNAGIPLDKSPKTWNVHEKSLVAQALEGIMEHIKLMLLDNHVFAEEVEPTGLVPMETILEKYRHAAVASTSTLSSEDERLKSRINVRFFHDSQLLGHSLQYCQSLLNTWYGSKKQSWELLYRASRDGFSADAFHQCCDGHAPTYVIIKGSTGSICGGFSDIPWSSNTPPKGRYFPSHRAFLFTLVNHQDIPPTNYDVEKSVLATLHHPQYGPIFGGGADLCISSNCNSGMESYSNFPHSYGHDRSLCSILMGDYNFTVTDYEVFTTLSEFL